MTSEGGIGLDMPRKAVTKYEGKILKGFREEERATLTPPVRGSDAVTIFRCEGCRSMNTDYSVYLLGKCWKCGGHKLSGGSPTFLETEVLIRRLDVPLFNLKHFLDTGEWGRGRSLWQALRDEVKHLPQTLFYQVVAPWEYHGVRVGRVLAAVFGGLFGKRGGAK